MISSFGQTAFAGYITQTLLVDGKEWAQVDLFSGLDWGDIDSVCSGGTCGAGTLNGFDMRGWSWASTDQMNALFNHYIGSDELGPGPDFYDDPNGVFAQAFFDDGWKPTSSIQTGSAETTGWVADGPDFLAVTGLLGPGNLGIANTALSPSSPAAPSAGAWFFRPEGVQVPVASSQYLLVITALILVFFRHRNRCAN